MANEKVLVAKQAVIDEITDKLTNAQSVVVAEYRGLTVDEVTELRRALRAENAVPFLSHNPNDMKQWHATLSCLSSTA